MDHGSVTRILLCQSCCANVLTERIGFYRLQRLLLRCGAKLKMSQVSREGPLGDRSDIDWGLDGLAMYLAISERCLVRLDCDTNG